MGGILTTNYFCAVIEGEVRYFPLYNTTEYFENAVCFVFRVNHRTLYLPARTSPYTTYITTSLVTRVGSTNYYGIIQQTTWFQKGYLMITANWHMSGLYMVGTFIVTSAGNTIGLDYTYTITPYNTESGASIISEAFTLSAGGEKSFEVKNYMRSAASEYSPFYLEISCDAASGCTTSGTEVYTTATYDPATETSSTEEIEFSLLES